MNEVDVEQTILAFLRKRVAVELPSANVIRSRPAFSILDSMMFVDLFMLIEEQFDVVAEPNDPEVENFATGRARDTVRRRARP